MLNFDAEQDQKEFNPGPVPAGSIVVVKMEVLKPHESRQKTANPYVSVAQSGLRQLYCQFDVVKGTYEGVSWRQNITLPMSEQPAGLTSGQETACRIGGSQFKAILKAANKRSVNDWPDFTDLKFPVKVKINNRPSESRDGRTFWKNEIQLIITPEMEQYATVRNTGEIINANGAVTGSGQTQTGSNEQQGDWADRIYGPDDNANMEHAAQQEFDDVPF